MKTSICYTSSNYRQSENCSWSVEKERPPSISRLYQQHFSLSLSASRFRKSAELNNCWFFVFGETKYFPWPLSPFQLNYYKYAPFTIIITIIISTGAATGANQHPYFTVTPFLFPIEQPETAALAFVIIAGCHTWNVLIGFVRKFLFSDHDCKQKMESWHHL